MKILIFSRLLVSLACTCVTCLSLAPLRGWADDAPSAASVIAIPSRVAVGGGWSDAGPIGEYFIGDKLTGAPAFTRREARLDFDWGTVLPVGGSTAEPYKSFPHDNMSVRWSGKLIARFSEPYVLSVMADSKPTLSVKDQRGQLTLIPLTLSADKRYESRPISLTTNHPVEIVLAYHHGTGVANCSLSWSSPSTPFEIISPVIEQGLNVASFDNVLWADMNRTRRWCNSNWGGAPLDENGQLSGTNGCFLMFESSEPTTGNYLISFTGSADLQFGLFGNLDVCSFKRNKR